MTSLLESWQFWAFMAAIIAALAAIFAKIGIADIGSDYATFVRTVVILVVAAAIVTATGQWQGVQVLGGRTGLFLVLSGLGTGASWRCYFRALEIGQAWQVAPIDKLSVVLVAVFAAIFPGEKLGGPHWMGIGPIAGGAVIVAVT